VPVRRDPLLKVAMALILEIPLGSMDELDADVNVVLTSKYRDVSYD
jgi:hypothetical protein